MRKRKKESVRKKNLNVRARWLWTKRLKRGLMLYVTNACFAETNGKLGRITGRSTTTVKTIPEIRT